MYEYKITKNEIALGTVQLNRQIYMYPWLTILVLYTPVHQNEFRNFKLK